MRSIKRAIRSRIGSDRGDSEIITTLMVIPLVIWLIFSLIDTSLYMQARSEVQNVARDGARQVAIYGGNDSRLNPDNKSISQQVFDRLYQNGKCTASVCTTPPVVTCTPNSTTAGGQLVSCSITYSYSAIYGNNPITGFAGFLGHSFTVSETAFAETGF